jgi:hypothetical protein
MGDADPKEDEDGWYPQANGHGGPIYDLGDDRDEG